MLTGYALQLGGRHRILPAMGTKINKIIRAAMTDLAREWGKQGGTARKAKLSPARRKAIAKKASRARWAKARARARKGGAQ